VTGWAVDDDHDGPITVALYVDGRFWRRVTADLERPDLEEQGVGPHGFATPHALDPSQQVEAGRSGSARTAPATSGRSCCRARR